MRVCQVWGLRINYDQTRLLNIHRLARKSYSVTGAISVIILIPSAVNLEDEDEDERANSLSGLVVADKPRSLKADLRKLVKARSGS